MRINQFLSQNARDHHLIRSESKETFFSIKKNAKRLKTSNIFSEASQNPLEPFSSNGLLESRNEYLLPNLKESHEDLTSTISSDNYLTFKSKQPRRKKIKRLKNNSQEFLQQQVASQNEQNLYSIKSPEITQKMHSLQNWISLTKNISVDKFLFLSKLGEGTYSEVYRVVQKATGFIYSLKVLSKQKMKNLNVEENLFREIKIQSFASHPHITKLYGFFDDLHFIYLICEYATDQNVYEHLNKSKAQGKIGLNVDNVSFFVGQICSAINYLHANFIIHRDIKPENMIITFWNTIKLCDFGWSVYNPRKELRSTFCGTPLYLAPQLINAENYSETVDVWALGVLTYELLTNEIPFKIKSIKDLKKVVSSQIKYTMINCKEAVDFIENSLKKDTEERKNIQELFHHPFLNGFHQQQNQ